MVHCDGPKPKRPDGFPTIIGDDVLIGHMAMIHGCTLEDRAFVGLGAIVMDGCRIASDAMLAAGAMLTQGKVIEARQMWLGRPAAYARDLTEAALAEMQPGSPAMSSMAGCTPGPRAPRRWRGRRLTCRRPTRSARWRTRKAGWRCG